MPGVPGLQPDQSEHQSGGSAWYWSRMPYCSVLACVPARGRRAPAGLGHGCRPAGGGAGARAWADVAPRGLRGRCAGGAGRWGWQLPTGVQGPLIPALSSAAWCCDSCSRLLRFASTDDARFGHAPAEGSKNRATAATSLNAHSSRSHALLSVRLTDAAGQSSVLHLVDLAGACGNGSANGGKCAAHCFSAGFE